MGSLLVKIQKVFQKKQSQHYEPPHEDSVEESAQEIKKDSPLLKSEISENQKITSEITSEIEESAEKIRIC